VAYAAISCKITAKFIKAITVHTAIKTFYAYDNLYFTITGSIKK